MVRHVEAANDGGAGLKCSRARPMLDTSNVAKAPLPSSHFNSSILTIPRTRRIRARRVLNSADDAIVFTTNTIREGERTSRRSFFDALPSAEVGVALEALRFLEDSMLRVGGTQRRQK